MPASLSRLLALASASGASASAVFGMNYASTNGDNSARTSSDFESYFKAAASLDGVSGITSARLYTMIQAGSVADPIEAISAAISTNTTLLLGLWASGDNFPNEVTALKNSIAKYGSDLANLAVGISVGSEDLYRISPTGIAAKSGLGAEPSILVDYIKQVRSAIDGTALKDVPIGHVDTWNVWTNGSNQAVIDNCDFIGVDEYPFWQNQGTDNKIENARDIFVKAYEATQAAVGTKPVWVTETGWPTTYNSSTGTDAFGSAVASVANAETYWQDVGCGLFNVVNTWYYIMSDTGANPSFGLSSSNTNTKPLYSLACPANTKPLFSDATSSNSTSANSTSTTSSTNSTSTDSSPSGSSGSSSSGNGASSGGSQTGSGSLSAQSSQTKSAATNSMASFGAMAFAIMVALVTL